MPQARAEAFVSAQPLRLRHEIPVFIGVGDRRRLRHLTNAQLEARYEHEWRKFRPQMEAWAREFGFPLGPSYEEYCRAHGVDP